MERIHFRSTSVIDLQAELRERDLLREAECRRHARAPHPVVAAGRFHIGILTRRLLG